MELNEFKNKLKQAIQTQDLNLGLELLDFIKKKTKATEKTWVKIAPLLKELLTSPDTYAFFLKKKEFDEKTENLKKVLEIEANFNIDAIEIDEEYPDYYPELLVVALKDAAKMVIKKAHLSNSLKYRMPDPQPDRVAEIDTLSDKINVIYTMLDEFHAKNFLSENSEKSLKKMYQGDFKAEINLHNQYNNLLKKRTVLIAQCKNPKKRTKEKLMQLEEVRKEIDTLNTVLGKSTTISMNQTLNKLLK